MTSITPADTVYTYRVTAQKVRIRLHPHVSATIIGVRDCGDTLEGRPARRRRSVKNEWVELTIGGFVPMKDVVQL